MGNTVDIRGAIVTKLEAIDKIRHVYYGRSSNIQGYPRAIINLDSRSAEILTTKHNEVVYEFSIDVYQEYEASGQGSQNAEKILEQIADELEDSFSPDTASSTPLSSTCDWIEPLEIEQIVEVDAENKILKLPMILRCHKLINNNI